MRGAWRVREGGRVVSRPVTLGISTPEGVEIREGLSPGDVVVPAWQGRRGHPVRWGRAHFPALMALSGDVGGKAVLAGLSPTEIPALSDAVYDDIDTPEALARLRGRPQEDA